MLEKKEIKGNPSARDLLENIQTEGERLSRLVRNLLEATRLESGAVQLHKEPYPLEEIVGSALEHLGKSLGGREVALELPEELPLVSVDAVLLEQVFVNLLENAVRHTPPKSRIDVAAWVESGLMHVSVADQGPGVPEEDLERVFDKFYREKSSPGAGLGLAICRAVVAAHGGKIWAENQAEHGAVFHFTLPLELPHGK